MDAQIDWATMIPSEKKQKPEKLSIQEKILQKLGKNGAIREKKSTYGGFEKQAGILDISKFPPTLNVMADGFTWREILKKLKK